MNKVELRKIYSQKRKLLSEAECLQYNYKIREQFFSHVDLSFINVLHCFLPMAKNTEPDTWLIIDRIRREFMNIRLSIPRINQQSNAIENFFFEGLHQLQENSWGIKEPKQGVPTEAQKIDIVLVPLLALDLNGHRVGYGKGYYDQFLASCRPDCQKIGISFFQPVAEITDTSGNDIKLNACLTPEAFYTFLP